MVDELTTSNQVTPAKRVGITDGPEQAVSQEVGVSGESHQETLRLKPETEREVGGFFQNKLKDFYSVVPKPGLVRTARDRSGPLPANQHPTDPPLMFVTTPKARYVDAN